MTQPLPTGKIPPGLLGRLLAGFPTSGSDVIVGPAVGEDAAVVRPGKGVLIAAKSDPITLTGHGIGRSLVQVNANDLAVMGATPRWLLVTVLLPSSRLASRQFATIMRELREACAEAEITLVGGHSEVTDGLARPVAVGTMLGEVQAARVLDKRAIRAGDELYMTGALAVEGTAALARDFRAALRGRGLGVGLLRRAEGLLRDPGISIVRHARIAAKLGPVRALHDPTEGGIAGAVWELGVRAGCGVLLETDAIPVLPETQLICRALGLDPLRLLASGALLIAAAPGSEKALARAFAAEKVDVTRIGRFLPRGRGSWARTGGKRVALRAPDRDELARAHDLGGPPSRNRETGEPPATGGTLEKGRATRRSQARRRAALRFSVGVNFGSGDE
jgi:hydrogenase maturation factor